WPDEAPPAGFQAAVLRRLRSLLPKSLWDQIDEGTEYYANNIASEKQVLERLHDEMSDESLLMLMQIYTQAKSVGSSTFSRNQELLRNRLPPALRARMEEAVRQEREHEAARPPQPVPAWQAIEQIARDMTEDSTLPTGALLVQLFLRLQSDRNTVPWKLERVRKAIPEEDLRACPNPDCGALSPVKQTTCVRCHLTPEQVESDRAIIIDRAVDILRKAHIMVGVKEYSCSVLSEEDGYAIVKLPLEATALIRAGILYIADPCEE
ncbi:MAG TPA: hypothetical protein PLA94_14650, partial [Myxococcota bacterium]|nr:hypothetical protein [Myxococcota bacterium]